MGMRNFLMGMRNLMNMQNHHPRERLHKQSQGNQSLFIFISFMKQYFQNI